MAEEKKGPLPGKGPGGGHGPGMGAREKPKDFKKTFKRLVRYLKPQLLSLSFVVALAVFGVLFNIITPKVLALATNSLQNGIILAATNQGGIDFAYIVSVLIGVVGLYTIAAVFSFFSQFISAGVTQKIVYRMRQDLKNKLEALPLSYYDTHQTGEILSRVTNDIETVAQSLQQSLVQIINSTITFIGVLVMMLTLTKTFTTNISLTMIAVATLPFYLIITAIIAKKTQKLFKQQQRKLGDLNGYIEEMFSARKVIKMYSQQDSSEEKMDVINDELRKSWGSAQFLSGIIMPMFRFIANIGYVVICVVGATFLGMPTVGLKLGDLQAFLQYSNQFSQPLTEVANIANSIMSTIAAAERVFAVLDECDEPADPVLAEPTDNVSASVEFRHVKFSYTPEKELIRDLSLSIPAGGKIAIVGPTGAGKTTLVNLLLRFYELNGGEILIDGKDIRSFTKQDLRGLFGMVLQDTWLENGTIRENIAYGAEIIDNERVKDAAERAHVAYYISTLSDGYDTQLNEETNNISGGQKQLMTIARAIYADPKILILDEATSNVDTRTESYIQNAMTEMMHGKTSFIIAHRLSTIRSASLILVMNSGDIVEQGTHDELLEKKGFYYNLYNAQFESAVE